MNTQYLTRKFGIDVGHRVIHEVMKCHNYHGHRFKVHLTYAFTQIQEIGYMIDFKEIKRVHGEWLMDYLDHGFACNPEDKGMIELCKQEGTKLWVMSLNDGEFCNPTAENLGKEIFLAIDALTRESYKQEDLSLHQIRLYETENCWVDTFSTSIAQAEKDNFNRANLFTLKQYAKQKGVKEYDARKLEN